MTATLMSEVCHNVKIEPGLQPVTGEQFEHRTANREDGAHCRTKLLGTECIL